MKPRRAQQPISIRSNRAAARLALLTRDGHSQARIIEEALDRMPDPEPKPEREPYRPNLTPEDKAQVERIMALVRSGPPGPGNIMAEFDALEYDEDGLPR